MTFMAIQPHIKLFFLFAVTRSRRRSRKSTSRERTSTSTTRGGDSARRNSSPSSTASSRTRTCSRSTDWFISCYQPIIRKLQPIKLPIGTQDDTNKKCCSFLFILIFRSHSCCILVTSNGLSIYKLFFYKWYKFLFNLFINYFLKKKHLSS